MEMRISATRSVFILFTILIALAGCRRVPGLVHDLDPHLAAVLYLADDVERRVALRAIDAGPDSLEAFLERFWARRDPLPETPGNEFKARFDARSRTLRESLGEEGGDAPLDDRAALFLLFGEPSRTSYLVGDRTIPDYEAWLYRPTGSIQIAAQEHPEIGELEFAVVFRVDDEGRYTFAPNSVRFEWPGMLPPLDNVKKLGTLEAILNDRSLEAQVRAAAAWRLGADPGPEALGVLLRHARTEDRYLRDVIALLITPLTAKGALPASDLPDVSVEPMGMLDLVRWFSPERDRAFRNEDPSMADQALTTALDPGKLLPASTVEELAAGSAPSDPKRGTRGWSAAGLDTVFVGVLEQGRRLVESGEVMAAHRLLDPLLGEEMKEEPEAWHLDALALMESEEPGGRQRAEELVRQALRLDPGNPRYLLTLAQILNRRTLSYYADDVLDRILADNPRAGEAYALKGYMRMEAYYALGWRSGAGGWGQPFSERGMSGMASRGEILQNYARALVADPGNPTAGWGLGTYCILEEAWLSLVQFANYLIREGSHVPEAYLARGMALQELGRLEMALADYERGFSLLPANIEGLARSPSWILPPSEGGVTLTARRGRMVAVADTGTAVGKRFWRSKDPLFSTGVNERLVEHYRRFAYITWMFAFPNLGLKGWETQKGLVYLRYGEPLDLVDAVTAIQEASIGRAAPGDIDPDPLARLTGGRLYSEAWAMRGLESIGDFGDEQFARIDRPAAVWIYPDFTVYFWGGMVTGNFQVRDAGGFDERAETVPDRDAVEGGREVHGLLADAYLFEDDQQGNMIVPVARVPDELVDSLISQRADIYATRFLPLSVITLNGEWEVVDRLQSLIPTDRITRGRGTDRVGRAVAADLSATGARYLAMEMVPPGEGPVWAMRDTIPFDVGTAPRVSSLVFGTNIVPRTDAYGWPDGTYMERQGLAIIPRPDNVFLVNEPILLYAEIYGLTLDEIGASDYEVALTIAPSSAGRRERPLISTLIGSVLRREEQEGRVTLVFEREGIQTTTHEQLRIVIPSERGIDTWEVVLQVRDRVSGTSGEQRAVIRIEGGG